MTVQAENIKDKTDPKVLERLWGLPSSWKWEVLGDIADVKSGATPKTSVKDYWNGNISWITPDDLSDHVGKVIERGKRSITKKGYDSCSAQMLPKGSIVFSSRAPIGYLAIAGGDLCTNQGCKNFVLYEGIDPEYVYYYMYLGRDFADLLASGTTFKEISGKRTKQIPIPLPDKRTMQRSIVEAIETQFTRLDSAIKTLDLLREKIDLYRMSVLKTAFVDRVFSSKECIWEEYEIKDIAKDVQYGLTSQSSSDFSGPKYLRITDIQDRKVDWGKVPFAKKTEDTDRYRLNVGDLVFARTGATVGKSYLIKEHPDNAVFASYLIRIVPNMSKVFPELLWYYFQSPMYWHDISSKQRGIGQPNVNGAVLSRLKLSIPKEIKEQEMLSAEIDSKFSALDKVQENIIKMLIKAKNLQKSILKAAFEGKLVKEGV